MKANQGKVLAGLAVLCIVLAVWLTGMRLGRSHGGAGQPDNSKHPPAPSMLPDQTRGETWKGRARPASRSSADEAVAARVADFARKRLEWVRAKALRAGQEIPREVEEFFEAMERGDWEEIAGAFSFLAKRSGQYEGSTQWPGLNPFWPAVLEAFGAAEQAHLWPADKLLEYAEGIMGSLRPGMVYVGGTDAGRFVPTLFNETGEGEPHVILTQNALADSRYLEYVREMYGDRLALPTEQISKAIFDDYAADARKRLEHDQRQPDGPRQVKPGEKVEIVNGEVQVSGQTAVMAINERLLRWILEKNPENSFAMEESFPFRSTYAGAAPLGPIMELRAEEGLDAQSAAAAVAYWHDTADKLRQSPGSESAADLKSYSKMAVSQANLLASRGFAAEAEAAYRLAREIFPRNTDAAFSYAEFLSGQGQEAAARAVLDSFRKENPDLSKDLPPPKVIP